MVIHRFALLICRVALLLSLLLAAGCALDSSNLYPEIAAHRGDRQAGADNSRRSISEAVQRRFPYIEIDLRSSKDGALLLVHDRSLHHESLPIPQVAENTPIKEVESADLRSVPLPRGNGPVLMMDEALQLVKGSHSNLLVDLKERDPRIVERLIVAAKAVGVFGNIILQCQQVDAARFVREHFPGLKILARANNISEVREYLTLTPEIVQVDADWVTADVVASVRATGAKLLIKAVDTVYDQDCGWRDLKKRGADIVLTDYPEDLSAIGDNPNRRSSISICF